MRDNYLLIMNCAVEASGDLHEAKLVLAMREAAAS
jgi:hypothetical protein